MTKIAIRSYKKAILKILITLLIVCSTITQIQQQNVTGGSAPIIHISAPSYGQIFFALPNEPNDPMVHFYAEITVSSDTYRLSKVTYKFFSNDEEKPATLSRDRKSAVIDEYVKASDLPMGPNRFYVAASQYPLNNPLDINERTANRLYYIKTYAIEVVYPKQYAYLDVDTPDGAVVRLKIQSSDTLNTKIWSPEEGVYKRIGDIDLNYHDTSVHYYDYHIGYNFLVDDSYANVDHEFVCYQTFKLLFTNRYVYNGHLYTYELLYHFKVIWNRAVITINLQAIYTGDGNDGLIEYCFAVEQLQKGRFNMSSIRRLKQRTTYYHTNPIYWSEKEYVIEYKSKENQAWLRKDIDGKVYTVEEQQRCIKTYDAEMFLGMVIRRELRYTLYYWLDPNSNPSSLYQNGIVFMDNQFAKSGEHLGFHWKMERNKNWGDYFFQVVIKIQLYALRTK